MKTHTEIPQLPPFKPVLIRFIGSVTLFFLLMSVMILMLPGCTKEGPEGPAGKDGQDGAANIQTSSVTANSSDWTYSNNLGWYLTINWNALSTSVINSGSVSVYEVNGGQLQQLPYTMFDGEYNYFASVGSVVIWFSRPVGTPANPGNKTYRIVAIPPV